MLSKLCRRHPQFGEDQAFYQLGQVIFQEPADQGVPSVGAVSESAGLWPAELLAAYAQQYLKALSSQLC